MTKSLALLFLVGASSLLSASARLGSSSVTTTTRPEDPELVVLAYSTYSPDDAMLWGSAEAHSSSDRNETEMIAIGQGVKLFDDPPKHTRGWMYRFRKVVEGIQAEYEAKGEDFIVVVGDAFDTYITKSERDDTLSQIKHRFLNDFDGASIVFSTQVYCCNPWNLHEVGRAAWDEHYDSIGGPETIYKHLNAGMFMGYATAIIDMANELNVFETKYKRHETFDELLATKGAANIHMFDIDVDDDEWQLSIWFLKDQQKGSSIPRAKLDVHQHLFTTTGTFRAANRDGGFSVFSQDDFYGMIGTLPAAFDKSDLDEVTLCPYTFDETTETWMNALTQSHPLVFHFAGNEWVCACNIMAKDQFNKPNKFADLCLEEAPFWYEHVNQGILDVSVSSDPNMHFALKLSSKEEVASQRLLSSYGDDRRLSGYDDDRRLSGYDDDRRLSGYDDRRLSGYDDRRLSGYDDRRLSGYDDRRLSGYDDRRLSGYDDRRLSGYDDRRLSGYDDRRLSGYDDRRLSGYDDRRLSGYDDRRLSGYDDRRLSGYDDRRLSGYDDRRLSGYDDRRLSGYDDRRLSGYDDRRLSGYDDRRLSGYDDRRLSGYDDRRLSGYDDRRLSGYDDDRRLSGYDDDRRLSGYDDDRRLSGYDDDRRRNLGGIQQTPTAATWNEKYSVVRYIYSGRY